MEEDKNQKGTRRLKRSKSTIEKLETIFDSKPARLIPKVFSFLLRLLRALIPRRIREYVNNLLSILQAKLLFQRLGLGNISKFFTYKTVEREILTIDGVSLKTTHLHPARDDGLQHPCIILRTPYYRYFDFAIGVHLVHKGYHVLLQDVRGRFDSGGEFTLANFEKADSRCTFKWIGEQPWSNKTAGVVGLSMGGYTSWTAYASSLETFTEHGVHVKCVAPIISSCDIIKDGLYYDLSSERRPDAVINLSLMARYTKLMHVLGSPRTIFGSTIGWFVFRLGSLFREMQGKHWKRKLMHLPLKDIDLVLTESVPNPRMVMIDDPGHEFFVERDHSSSVELLGKGFVPGQESGKPPHGCFISGWYDIFARTTIRDFQLAARNADNLDDGRLSLVMGDWQHFDDFLTVSLRESVRAFDRALMNHKPKNKLPPVRVLCVGAKGYFRTQRPFWETGLSLINPSTSQYSISNESHHAWREFSNWPPPEADTEYLTLMAGRKLLPEVVCDREPEMTESLRLELEWQHFDSFVWDPFNPTPTLGGRMFGLTEAGIKEQSKLIKRDDVVVFTTPRLSKTVEIAGNVWLDLFVASSAISMDVFAKLCIVLPEKSSFGKDVTYNLCEGIERCTLDVEAGDQWPKKVRVNVGPICAQFQAGSKIRLILAGGSFPQFSRNLGFGDPNISATRVTTSKNRIIWARSKLELPVISKTTLEEALSCDRGFVAEDIFMEHSSES